MSKRKTNHGSPFPLSADDKSVWNYVTQQVTPMDGNQNQTNETTDNPVPYHSENTQTAPAPRPAGQPKMLRRGGKNTRKRAKAEAKQTETELESHALTLEDKRVWQIATGKINPHEPQTRPPKHDDMRHDKAEHRLKSSRAALMQNRTAPLKSGNTTQIDKRTAQKFKRGHMRIDARLDLHGMTEEQAYGRLTGFINAHVQRGSRCLLVVTGKGKQRSWPETSTGVLRTNLPRWLNTPELKPFILSFTPAAHKHGGSGAFYVLLKRSRA